MITLVNLLNFSGENITSDTYIIQKLTVFGKIMHGIA